MIVGIDLGTTNSFVAFMDGDRPEIIPNKGGKRLTPSIVGLDKAGSIHVGDTARNQLVSMPERTVAEVKRLMGSDAKVALGDRTYSPQEISGFVLKSLKDDAERYLEKTIEEAVITVPAYFTDAQRQATKDAGELAGFRVDRILNEPTAAALAYGLDHLDKEQFVLVYDLGGGTFDVSVLEMFEGVLDVKASAGNNQLGGGDFDRLIADFLAAQFEKEHGLDLRKDPKARMRLKTAAEQAKIELSSTTTTQVMLPFIAVKGSDPLSLELELTRAKLEELLGDLIRSTVEPINVALKDAKLDKSAITDVVLVGGSSRIPMVQGILLDLFKKEPRRGVHPDEAIALGAAVQAGLKQGTISADRGIMITDVCPYTMGVEVSAQAGRELIKGLFSPIIPRNSTVPVSRTETYLTTADNQRVVDIKVYQGNDRLVKNNTFLDAYSVEGIPPAPAGSEKVAITFTYDINGILHVKTKIVSTGKEATLKVEKTGSRMNDDQREAAKERLEKEWGGSGGMGAAQPSLAAKPSSPSAPASTGPAPTSAMLTAAKAKLGSVSGENKERLAELVSRLEAALSKKDAAEVARLDAQLTDLLFDLEG